MVAAEAGVGLAAEGAGFVPFKGFGGTVRAGGGRLVDLNLAANGPPAGFLRRRPGAGPPFGVVDDGPEGGPAGDALIVATEGYAQRLFLPYGCRLHS